MTSTYTGMLTIRDDGDRTGHLLDEFDDLIREIDDAMQEAEAARLTIGDCEVELAVREASAQLTATGSNESIRKAMTTLALREDDAYQQLMRVHRDAKGALWASDRRLRVARYRVDLVRASLMLLCPQSPPAER